MILVDSSIVIAAFREAETHHLEALEILNLAGNILILDYVLLEVATVLKLKEGHKTATCCLDFLTNNENVFIKSLEDHELQETITFFQKNKNKLSFVDTALLVFKKMHHTSLATFDQELIKNLERQS